MNVWRGRWPTQAHANQRRVPIGEGLEEPTAPTKGFDHSNRAWRNDEEAVRVGLTGRALDQPCASWGSGLLTLGLNDRGLGLAYKDGHGSKVSHVLRVLGGSRGHFRQGPCCFDLQRSIRVVGGDAHERRQHARNADHLLRDLVVQRSGKARGSAGRGHFWAEISKKSNIHVSGHTHTHTPTQVVGYRKRPPPHTHTVRAYAPARSSKSHPRAPHPDPRLKPEPVFIASGGVKILTRDSSWD